ncbi:ATP-dependent RNA helicase DBP7 [Ceratocystis fimbriata CBS 114723]|uniref:ATP-dependent RNA helicase n=1 Tax=Ceratocystis fimbriata CBS 114723 TaxID=1035309 RepID=A0A2C5XE91_9PEZI|nr:ATP-dependent RNA helicase DBP7 [Ceratocystis fimbriata CBS 114723]
MADDGILVNFEIGDLPVKQNVKFQGGRWRDRMRAQKSARREADGTVSSHDEPAKRKEPSRRPSDDSDDDSRPSKKQRPNQPKLGSNNSNNNASGGPSKRPVGPGKHVTSSLFSSNPQHVTDMDQERAADSTPAEPTNAPLTGPAASFAALGLSDRVVRELAKMELSHPTAIQKKTIPLMVNTEDDAFIQAQTGSGKTLAYLLPMVHRVLALSKQSKIQRDSGIFAIVLTPTRELAKQTHAVLQQLLKSLPWLVASAITGGESKKAEKARIRKGINFLVATPGRLSDHLTNTQVLKLSTVRWLILDEGDRLMDMGFEEDVKKIVTMLRKAEVATKSYDGMPLEILPKRRVTVLCSATLKMTVQRLGEMSLDDAVHIAVTKEDLDEEKKDAEKDKADDSKDGKETTSLHETETKEPDATEASTNHLVVGGKAYSAPAQLKQTYLIVPAKLRLVTLLSYLKFMFARRDTVMKAILFISCADSVDFHYDILRKPKPAFAPTIPPEAGGSKTPDTVSEASYITSAANPRVLVHKLHGSLPQSVRTATLDSFSKCKEPGLLVTTDVAARGLDIPDVDHVIELDPAFSVEDHIHRIGRTARAGRAGKATLFLMPGSEEGYVELLKAGSAPMPLLYDSVLKNAMGLPWELPTETHARMEDKSFTRQAENLQLHLEQRLLDPNNKEQLELGRNAFRSHVRAYATHVKEERVFFDISNLHLGHMAKSFGLRDAPSGIGKNIERKASKAAKAANKRTGGSGSGSRTSTANGARSTSGGGTGTGSNAGAGDDDAEAMLAARRMLRKKSMMMMNTASEFNIG